LHPDVDKFIGSVAGIQCNNEVVLFIVFIWILIFCLWLHGFICVLAWVNFCLILWISIYILFMQLFVLQLVYMSWVV
jgi:hypothetical protein